MSFSIYPFIYLSNPPSILLAFTHLSTVVLSTTHLSTHPSTPIHACFHTFTHKASIYSLFCLPTHLLISDPPFYALIIHLSIHLHIIHLSMHASIHLLIQTLIYLSNQPLIHTSIHPPITYRAITIFWVWIQKKHSWTQWFWLPGALILLWRQIYLCRVTHVLIEIQVSMGGDKSPFVWGILVVIRGGCFSWGTET